MKHNIINSIFAISLLLIAAVGFQSCSNDNEPQDKPEENQGTDEIVNVPDDNFVTNNLILKSGEPYQLLLTPGKSKDESVYTYFSKRGHDLKIDCKNKIVSVDSITGKLRYSDLGYDIVDISLDGGASIYRSVYLKIELTMEITMNSLESRPIIDIIGEEQKGHYWSAYNIAYIHNGMLTAYQAGTGIVFVNEKAIKVTVIGYDGPPLFKYEDLPILENVEWTKSQMSDYPLIDERIETIDNIEYTVLTYAPFENCKSITCYVNDKIDSDLNFSRIETGKSPIESQRILLGSFEPSFWDGEIDHFVLKDFDRYRSDWLYPVDGNWSVVQPEIMRYC